MDKIIKQAALQTFERLSNEPYAEHLPTLAADEIKRALPHSAWAAALGTELRHAGLRLPPGMPIKATRSIATAVKQLARGEVPKAPPAHQAFEFLAFADYADAQPLIEVALQAIDRQDQATMRASLRTVAPAALGDNAYAQAQRHIVQGFLDHSEELRPSEDHADDAQLAELLLAQATYATRPGACDFMARFAPVEGVLQWMQRTELSGPRPASMLARLVARATPTQAAQILAHCLTLPRHEPGIWSVALAALALVDPTERSAWVEKFLVHSQDFSVLPEPLIPMFRLLPSQKRQSVLRACSPEKQLQVLQLAATHGAGDQHLLADCLAVTPPTSGEAGTQASLLAHAMTLPDADLQAMWALVPTSDRAECLHALQRRVPQLPATAAALRWFFAAQRSTPQALERWLQDAKPVQAWLKARHAAALRGSPTHDAPSFAAWIEVLRETQSLHTMLQTTTGEIFKSGSPALMALQLAALTEFPNLHNFAASEIRHGLKDAHGDDLTYLVQAAPRWLSKQQIAKDLQQNRLIARAPMAFLAAAEAQNLLGSLLTQTFVEKWCALGGEERVRSLLDACDCHPTPHIDYASCLVALGPLHGDSQKRLEICLALCARLDDASLQGALTRPESPFRTCDQAGFMRLAAMATERLGFGDLPVYLSLALRNDKAQEVHWALQQAKSFNVLPAALAHDHYAAVMNRSRYGSSQALQLLLTELSANGQLQDFLESRPDCLAHFVKNFAPELTDAVLGALLEAQQSGKPWANPEPFVQAIDAQLQGPKDWRFLARQSPRLMAFLQADAARWHGLLSARQTTACSIM